MDMKVIQQVANRSPGYASRSHAQQNSVEVGVASSPVLAHNKGGVSGQVVLSTK